MSDATVSVTFSASTGDFAAGVASARDAIASLAAPIADINGKYAALGVALGEAHERALQAIQAGDSAAQADALRAAQEAISDQIKAEEVGLKTRLATYAEDARSHAISEAQKLQSSREAVEQTFAAELTLEGRRRDLAQSSLAERQRIDNQISALERGEQQELAKLTEDSVKEQIHSYEQLGKTVTHAFDSQLRGLLSGTETWRDAARKMLGDLLISFIESTEQTVVQWAAAEAAKTSATVAGTASRTATQDAGNSAALATQAATMVRSIIGSSAEAFAGVFGFLAPVMGPFAAGPAAAAQATVASAAGAVASADIGMWSVPADMLTLVHHNELIMPASEAGAFRDLLSTSTSNSGGASANVAISPTTHFHVNALDGGSVSQWMRSNAPEMLRAINEAVRHGAHLGLRRLATS